MASIVSAQPREYLSIDGAAERLGVSTTTIRRCIPGGQLRAFRTGKRLIRIRIGDLEELFCEIPITGGAAATAARRDGAGVRRSARARATRAWARPVLDHYDVYEDDGPFLNWPSRPSLDRGFERCQTGWWAVSSSQVSGLAPASHGRRRSPDGGDRKVRGFTYYLREEHLPHVCNIEELGVCG